MESLYRIDKREAVYTLGKNRNFDRLFQILNLVNGDVATFYVAKDGNLFSTTKRIFGVRDLHEKDSERRKKRSVLIATTPQKDQGFFIPWNPYSQKNESEILQIVHRGNLLFENSILIKELGLEK
ncbi:MAG: hypothetical protein KKF67_03190 [Nanoarchaeota archaeon]|nr:hypothetical protein [Nanoarchaeota archaeon]